MEMVEIRNLHKSYHGKEALKGIDLSLSSGEIVGLFGPNGSGKTTLIKVLANLLSRYDGEVLIDGKKPGVETKRVVSYLPDVNYLYPNWSVGYCVKVFKTFYRDFDEAKALDLLEKFHLKLKDKVRVLSKGTKEKLQIILVLSRKAKVYLFDEPLAGVDPASRAFIFHFIMENYNKDATVIITTHLISDIEEITDHIVFINDGKIVLDNSKEKLMEIYPDKTIEDIFLQMFQLRF